VSVREVLNDDDKVEFDSCQGYEFFFSPPLCPERIRCIPNSRPMGIVSSILGSKVAEV